MPTEGAESPWGGAQLTFIARRDVTPQPPQTPQALLEFAKANPGTVTYPRPPDFTGTAFLEQLLIMLTPDPTALKEAPDDATFARVTAPLWQYLDALHPYLWREGKDFPPSPARMDALLKANTLRLSLTFNPAHAQQKIASGDLPASSYSFGFREGMIGNVHFVTIPANANASAAAKVVANFLLSPDAQLRKADPAVWGDPSVLDPQKLPDGQRETLQSRMPQDLPPVLAEPHRLGKCAGTRMATPLRYALIFLLWAMIAVIYAPLIPAALTLISPALSLTHWQALFADPQLPQALLATLVSTTIAAVGALLIALLVIVALWPGPKWQRMCARLPWLLAIPHVAFATSALLLFADGGLLYDYFPYFTPPMDKLGIGLGLTLAVKESAFLLWILAAVLSEKRLLQQLIVLDSLGYSRWQCLNWLLLPSVASALAMAMLAIVAWSLSVVDVAIILSQGQVIPDAGGN